MKSKFCKSSKTKQYDINGMPLKQDEVPVGFCLNPIHYGFVTEEILLYKMKIKKTSAGTYACIGSKGNCPYLIKNMKYKGKIKKTSIEEISNKV